MTKISIAYAPDTNFIPLTLVSMASVLKNADADDEIEFVIMHAGLEDKYLKVFDNLQNIKNYKLRCLKVDKNLFVDFPCPNWVTLEAWFRCLLADLLPDMDKILYLDCDTIVRKSLKDLFNIKLGDNLVGVIEDVSQSKQKAQNIGLKDNFYFNSGVMYINLEAWRKVGFFDCLKKIVADDQKISNDQDALNKASEGRKLRLSPSYDYMQVWWRSNNPEYDKAYAAEFERIADDPTIVHFTGVKPNHPDCRNKFKGEYLDYSKLVSGYEQLQSEIGIKKAGKGREKKVWWRRIFGIEYSTDRRHRYIDLFGFTIKQKIG